MKKNILIGVIIFVQISIAFCQNNQNNFPVLTGPYLGQTPPGKTPEIFAPGIINPNLHGCPVFSPDGNEAYWNLMEGGNHIIGSFVENGIWTNPQELDIFNSLNNSGEPCLSVDGNKLFVISRTSIGIGQPVKENIWYAERIPGTSHWGVPQPLSHYVNSMEMHWQMSIAENENIYFHSLASGGGDIYMSEFINGDYSNPIRLGPHVNTEEGYENTPYIAPDESYIIFSRVIWGSPEEGELFISFKIADREWSEAISMDLLNENYSSQLCPNLSPDGNYLFYISQTSQGNTTFWIDAEIIDDLNPISGTKDK
ncbi:TolB family protein, partial [Bacteroidota bacterium]